MCKIFTIQFIQALRFRTTSYTMHVSGFILHSFTFQVFRSICKEYVYKSCFIFLDWQKPLVKHHKDAYTMLPYMTRREKEAVNRSWSCFICSNLNPHSYLKCCRDMVYRRGLSKWDIFLSFAMPLKITESPQLHTKIKALHSVKETLIISIKHP